MKLKKKTLQIFFLITNLNPVFFEFLLDSIKDFNKDLAGKNKRIIKTKELNKTIILFPIYLNLFSTKKINTQENEGRVYVNVNRANFVKEKKKRFLSKVLNNNLKPQEKVFFHNLNLSKYNENHTSQLRKSTKMLQNLKML